MRSDLRKRKHRGHAGTLGSRPADRSNRRRQSDPAAGDLESKPAPDTIITACKLLGVEASQAATFETTLVGLDASRTAGVGFSIAIDRSGRAEALRDHGAQNVVADLVELLDPRW